MHDEVSKSQAKMIQHKKKTVISHFVPERQDALRSQVVSPIPVDAIPQEQLEGIHQKKAQTSTWTQGGTGWIFWSKVKGRGHCDHTKHVYVILVE